MKRPPAKPRAKKKAATVVGDEVPFRPLAELDLLAGDEVELRACSPGDVTMLYIGILARGRAFKAPRLPDDESDRYTWPPDDTPARVLRSPNRERKKDDGVEVDPVRGGLPSGPLFEARSDDS